MFKSDNDSDAGNDSLLVWVFTWITMIFILLLLMAPAWWLLSNVWSWATN